MEISPRLIGFISCLMIFTYVITGLIYPTLATDYDRYGTTSLSWSDYDDILVMSFPQWIQVQYMYGYTEIIEGTTYNIDVELAYDFITVNYVHWNYDEDDEIFNKYGTHENAGMLWYYSPWVQGFGLIEVLLMGKSRAEVIKEHYRIYKEEVTEALDPTTVEDVEKGIVDQMLEFFGSIVNGFLQFVRILSFTNIPNTPVWFVAIMNIFFIPMWIVLVIGIAPYVAKLMEALSKFLDSITPFT
jgi:hypothetical protein